jgi:hypothetical protein
VKGVALTGGGNDELNDDPFILIELLKGVEQEAVVSYVKN